MKARSLAVLVLGSLLMMLPTARFTSQPVALQAESDWPLFRGDPLQTGVAHTTLPDKLDIRWKVDLKKGIESTAAIVKDTVYVGCFDEHLYAFDLATGKQKWKTRLGSIKAAPSYHEGMLFVGDEDGIFYCVDAATGTRLWYFETGGEITAGANFSGNNVLFGSHDSTLYCIALKPLAPLGTLRMNGSAAAAFGGILEALPQPKPLWKVKTEGPVNGAPLVANGQTFVAGCDSHLHIIDVVKGQELAKIELSGQAAATAAVFSNNLYVGNMNSEMQGLDLKKQNVTWSYAPKRAQPFYSSAAVTDNLVVVGCRDRYVHAMHRVKGDKAWSFQATGRVDSSPVIVGRRVYVGSSSGTLHVLDLQTGKETQSLELGQGVLASPAAAHGSLVIGTTDGLLYCLGKK
jgi:outer membrane protein assembly factor BamB